MTKLTRFLWTMLLSSASMSSFAYDFESGGIYYNVLSTSEKTCEVTYKTTSYNSYAGTVDIPSTVGNDGITYNVTSVGTNAFRSCSDLASVRIPNGVTSIGDSAFYESSIKSVVVGTDVLSVGSRAFYHCGQLYKMFLLPNTVPGGLSSSSLESLSGRMTYVANGNYASLKTYLGTIKEYNYLSSMFSVDGVHYLLLSPSDRTCDVVDCDYTSIPSQLSLTEKVSNQGIELIVKNVQNRSFYGNTKIQSLTINNTGVIGDYAFYGCINLQKANIIDNVTEIGAYCFQNSHFLSEVTLPTTLKSISDYVFDGCTSLASIQLSEGLTTIGSYAFRNTGMSELTFPSTVTSISDGAFNSCTSLSKITLSDGQSELSLGTNGNSNGLFYDCPLTQVYIGRNLKYNTGSDYGYSPFYRSATLQKVTVSDYPTTIYSNEFYGCAALTDVCIGDAVTSIGDYAFSGCNKLTTFTFGEGLMMIGAEAFSDCTALTSLSAEAIIPPTCDNQALDDINKWTCQLFTPSDAADAYKVASQWKDFFFFKDLTIADRNLFIETANNPLTVIKISAAPVITFTNTELQLSFNSGKNTWAFADFKKWYFGRVYSSAPVTGIEEISADAVQGVTLQFIAEGVSVKGAKGQPFVVSNMSGVIMENGKCKDDDFVLLVKHYPVGVYIVKVGVQTLKLYVNQ